MSAIGIPLGAGRRDATGALLMKGLKTILPDTPIITRGVPVTDSGGFGGNFAATNSADSNGQTSWRSVNSPNGASAQWLCFDLRGVANASKQSVVAHFRNNSRPTYNGTATLGTDPASPFTSMPADYQLQYHTGGAGGQPAVADVGWTDAITAVTNNRWAERSHGPFAISNANWFRFYCTRASGAAGNNDVQLALDVFNVAGATAMTAGSFTNGFFSYGDSIMTEWSRAVRPDNAAWDSLGSILDHLQAISGRVYWPLWQDGSQGGQNAAWGNTNKATYIGQTLARNIVIGFGTNDANGANIDLNTLTPAGVNSVYAQTFKSDVLGMITYAVSLGKRVILRKIPWGSVSAWSAGNVQILNQILDQLVADPTNGGAQPANAGQVVAGTDYYAHFFAHQNQIRDGIHPGWDSAQTGQLYNGFTGYANAMALDALRLQALYY
jgi:hypothetical protein